MKKNILVFPCGSEIGLEIYKSISSSAHFNVIGGSSIDDHGKFVYKNYIGNLPFVEDHTFIEKLNDVIKVNNIDFIFPAHDSVVLKLAQDKAAGKLECDLVTSPLATCEIARSKLKTYEIFKDVILTPKIFGTVEELQDADYPIFLKPDVGQSSIGTHIAKNIRDVEFYTSNDDSLLMMEYLPGKEFTVDCFTNKDGKLLFNKGRIRKRISGGISVNSITVNDQRFDNIANAINQTIALRGAWFFQVKENTIGELVLMEISPRIAGTMSLMRCKGVNLVLLSLFDALGYEVAILENSYSMSIDRALQNIYEHDIKYKHVYLDFDDLLIFEGKINPAIMAFVYQCINKQVSLHLITRHKEDLDANLEKYRLEHVFDEVIWIKNNDKKHIYIKENESIFIDDSFVERKEVYEALKIPVFDSHMIESLMEIS